MRISSDKVNKLAHTIADTLAETDECDFLEDRNTIRQEARKALEKLLAEETKLDASARLKIASQRKIILEGSQEWDILYRKYYNDEVRVILDAFQQDMLRTGANYQEMFKKVKNELVRKYKAVL